VPVGGEGLHTHTTVIPGVEPPLHVGQKAGCASGGGGGRGGEDENMGPAGIQTVVSQPVAWPLYRQLLRLAIRNYLRNWLGF
jgi:hypothetical protein